MVRAKRISLFLCGLVASLACLQATPVHAAESASSTVSTSVDSTYTVTVDKTQTISESDYDTYKSRGYYSFTARVSDYDIAYGSELVIKPVYDNQVWSSNGKDSVTGVLPSSHYSNTTYVSGADDTNGVTATIICGLPQDLSAGAWSTTISLDVQTIDLNTLEPGLYGGVLDGDSTNKSSSSFGQAYSWDKLLELGYINVTDGVFTSNLNANMSNIYGTTLRNGEDMILVMDDSVTQVGNGTDPLSYCGRCIVLPDSACTIADKAFYKYSGALDIYFNGCTSVGASSFNGTNFNKLGCSHDYDGDTQLSYADNLYKLYMPNVTTIKDNAFYGATGIYSFVADESLDYIDWNAFNSADIRKVDLRAASSTLTVNVNAFTNCSKATIYLPDDFVLASPVAIGNHHFSSAGIYSGVSKVVYSGSSHTLADLQTLGGDTLPTFEDALGNTITE